MKVTKNANGLAIIDPSVFKDERGYFFESFNEKAFKEMVADVDFVQDNESKSSYGVVRGLHFQKPPYAQSKLVRVVRGAVVDFAVDIRRGSPTYGTWNAVYLSAENHKQFFIPRGFAHGFISLSDDTVFQYKCDNYYNKESEGALNFDSTFLNGPIPIGVWLLADSRIFSDKDRKNVLFDEWNDDTPFEYEGEDNTIDEQ